MKHAKGPWKTGGTIGLRKTIFNGSGNVAKVLAKNELEATANAALIAAAPDLLEALESLTHEVYRLSGNTLSPKSEPIMVKALESMRKAKGEE